MGDSFFEYLIDDILPETNKSRGLFLKALIIVLILGISILTLIDFYSNKDLNSTSSIINNQDIQFDLRKNELKFRESLILEKTSFNTDINFKILDSISKNQSDIKTIKRYLLIDKLKNSTNSFEFETEVNKHTGLSPLVQFSKIKTTYSIDFERLENIIQSSEKNALTDEILKFGNYLNTSYKFEKNIQTTRLIITVFVIVALIILLFFINRIGLNTRENKIEQAAKNLVKDKENIKKAKEILDDDTIDIDEIKTLKKLLFTIEKTIDSYSLDNILESVLFDEVSKAEKKSLELYNRSTLMLILGLLVAIAGIVVFYLTLPEYNNGIEPKNYLALTIRPALILVFVQTISFYLLKQYRSLINDFKHFHQDYSKKSRIFSIYQLIQSKELNENEEKFIEMLMTDNNQVIDQEVKSSESNVALIEMLKTIIKKIK